MELWCSLPPTLHRSGSPVLLSGLPSLVLSKSEIAILQHHYKLNLERIQKLHKATPESVVYFLGGQRAPKFHQLQIPSRTKFRRPYPSRAKYGGYDTKSIQNGLIWALKWLIYTLFELKSVNIRGVNLIMALYLPELT